MTLYLFPADTLGSGKVASLRDKLTDRGWGECSECDGWGEYRGEDNEWREGQPCPDCVEGLVPPEGMVEAAARANWNTLGNDETWDDVPNDGRLKPDFMRAERAALIAAARWEREQ